MNLTLVGVVVQLPNNTQITVYDNGKSTSVNPLLTEKELAEVVKFSESFFNKENEEKAFTTYESNFIKV